VCQLNATIKTSPMTFASDGHQFIALAVGSITIGIVGVAPPPDSRQGDVRIDLWLRSARKKRQDLIIQQTFLNGIVPQPVQIRTS
jgi:hypothetical protein